MDTVLNARFAAEVAPLRAPGMCFLCRTANPDNGPFVNTRLSHVWFNDPPSGERDGIVYICQSCIKDLAAAVEYSDSSVQAKINEVRLAAFEEGKRAAHREFLDNATRALDSLGPVIPVSVESGSSSPLPAKDPAPRKPKQQRVKPEPVKDSGSADDNAGSEGTDGVSGDSTAGDLFGTLFDEPE